MRNQTGLLWTCCVIALTTGAAIGVVAAPQDDAAKGDDTAASAPIPPDIPLPKSPPNQAMWLRHASILQPYGHSAFTALVHAPDRALRLREEFGFNAIIVQPPDSHNTIARAEDQLTEEQFRDGVDTYRAAGYRLLLYTSVMAAGLSPEFQSGALAKAHPDWLQRDARGNPVLVWGVPWLCPNTGARDLALERCTTIVSRYKADGVMLDNNQFFVTESGGWTCHCDACTRKFREYVSSRCGEKGATQLFGKPPSEIAIPSEEGPLHALWVQWRNRVWAEINESFRTRLRKLNPDILFFANTQYDFDSGMLATDAQYEREDVVLSESVGLNSRQLSAKLALGRALAAGRPLWNYIGTFAKPEDYTGLKSASVIGPMISATLAHGARPWIVDGFDDGPTDAEARREMSRLLGWQARHDELFDADPWAEVAAIVSHSSRNNLKRPLTPPHVYELQASGTPVILLRDENVSEAALRPFRVVTVETAGYLSDAAADSLATWVRTGGALIANSDIGAYDELGRKRTTSSLWQALGLEVAPHGQAMIGKGAVLVPEPSEFARAAVDGAQSGSFQLAADSGVEVVAYSKEKTLLLHIIGHQPSDQPMRLRLPRTLRPGDLTAEVHVPGSSEATSQALSQVDGEVTLELATTAVYCVVRIRLP